VGVAGNGCCGPPGRAQVVSIRPPSCTCLPSRTPRPASDSLRPLPVCLARIGRAQLRSVLLCARIQRVFPPPEAESCAEIVVVYLSSIEARQEIRFQGPGIGGSVRAANVGEIPRQGWARAEDDIELRGRCCLMMRQPLASSTPRRVGGDCSQDQGFRSSTFLLLMTLARAISSRSEITQGPSRSTGLEDNL
jgi:hypothetical protein